MGSRVRRPCAAVRPEQQAQGDRHGDRRTHVGHGAGKRMARQPALIACRRRREGDDVECRHQRGESQAGRDGGDSQAPRQTTLRQRQYRQDQQPGGNVAALRHGIAEYRLQRERPRGHRDRVGKGSQRRHPAGRTVGDAAQQQEAGGKHPYRHHRDEHAIERTHLRRRRRRWPAKADNRLATGDQTHQVVDGDRRRERPE